MLAEQIEFEPYSAFRRIDRYRTGFIESTDLKAFLRLNGLFITETEAFSLLKSLSNTGRARLNYGE